MQVDEKKTPEWGEKEWFDQHFDGADNSNLGGDNWGHRWRGNQIVRHKHCFALIKNRVKAMHGGAILDLACGLCEFSGLIYSANRTNKIYVTDISENAIKYVEENHKEFSAKVEELPHIDFPPQTMDIIVCLEVLYYLSENDFRLSLENMNKVLKPNGRILISGKVNAGDRYNDEENFIREIERVYSIVKIDYLYNYLENQFEAPFLFILNNFIKNKKGVIARILKFACHSERRAEMLNLLTRKIYGEKGKTHIFILCKKK
ncbi:MAG: class I SAM-dependent methyltransferase [Lachnospiraceae bacterium]|nr:class I SAM-dependent methyltransferase [Lachnospiraceae bacterium]